MLVVISLAGGCRGGPPPTQRSLEPVPVPVPVTDDPLECGLPFETAETAETDETAGVAERLRLVASLVTELRSNRCGPTAPAHRLCVDLFLIGATDPLAALGLGLTAQQLDELGELHDWALADAAVMAVAMGEEQFVTAIRSLEAIDVSAALDGTPSQLADAAIARGAASIIGPLAAAEAMCLSLPR